MTIDTSVITKNWKSTAVGLSVLLIGAIHSVHFDAAGHLQMTARDWFSVAGGVLGGVVGAASVDAGKA